MKLTRRVKKAVNKALPHPVKATKRKVRAEVKAVKKELSPKRAVKRQVKKATHQQVTCGSCGRKVRGVWRNGRWQVGPHNRPTSHIPCEGVVENGHKRVKGKR